MSGWRRQYFRFLKVGTAGKKTCRSMLDLTRFGIVKTNSYSRSPETPLTGSQRPLNSEAFGWLVGASHSPVLPLTGYMCLSQAIDASCSPQVPLSGPQCPSQATILHVGQIHGHVLSQAIKPLAGYYQNWALIGP